jgi:hypothetical protein
MNEIIKINLTYLDKNVTGEWLEVFFWATHKYHIGSMLVKIIAEKWKKCTKNYLKKKECSVNTYFHK